LSKVKTLQLGLISTKPLERIEDHLDLINYVASKLSPGMQGKVLIASEPAELVRLIKERAVDLYLESAYATSVINEQTGAKILLRRWKNGVAEYRTLLLAKADNGITQPKDLLGKMIALEDLGSTSGYFLPKAYLVKGGFKVVPKSSVSDRKDLDPAVVQRVKTILLAMHQDGAGQKALKKADKSTRFDPLPGTDDMLYIKIRELSRLVEKK
jgi:ABC-type phosphate/phosphonate transport system substrate-binding protein